MKAIMCLGAGMFSVLLGWLLTCGGGCTRGSSDDYGPVPYLVETDEAVSGEAPDAPAGDESATDGSEPAGNNGSGRTATHGAAGYVSTSPAADEEAGVSSVPGDSAGAGLSGPQSGLLTAGSFDDHLNLDVFRSFLTELLQADVQGRLPNLSLGQRIIVTVRDVQGNPVPDARVVIAPHPPDAQDPEAGPLLDQTTGSDGRVLFLTGLDGPVGCASYSLTVYPPDGSGPIVEVRDRDNLDWIVTLASPGPMPCRLDLAFVVDTTGSMSDELEYLKAEVGGMAAAVKELFPEVAQRYALIVYRDQADTYVVRSFDFTESLADFQDNLAAQVADGGDDWPEAMHLALEAAANLSWSVTDTARVLFLIADAPPHIEHGQRTVDAIQALRCKTVSIYPVAASGTDQDLEFFMRAAAFLTLGEYIFLTDESGVGNSHAEPHLPCYYVQHFSQLMVRMIRSELTGRRVEPDPAQIVRTVGHPEGGLCTPAPGPDQSTQGSSSSSTTPTVGQN